MAKYAIEKYPKGSYPKQQSDGRYIEGYLKSNLDVLAKNIVNDMTFLGIIFSSTLEVGTGKSVFSQHVAEYWQEAMKTIHNIEIPFDINNIVFRPKDLIDRAFHVPKYSCIIVDEWEDSTYWSELGMTLRDFFRRCRQLNLFILVICPNFFQLPKNYAISRSVFAVDVRFEGEFERGYFRFFNFEKKRTLYIKGKKEENYYAINSDFKGRFVDGYVVGRQAYLDAKKKSFEEDAKQKEKDKLTPAQIRMNIIRDVVPELMEKYKIPQKELAQVFKLSRSHVSHIINDKPLEVSSIVVGVEEKE